MQDAALDRQGDLWTTDGISLFEFKPPFTAGSVPVNTIAEAGTAIAFDAAGNMYVGRSNGIDVFHQPSSAGASNLAFTISNTTTLVSLALDATGNLYATNDSGSLLVFPSPLTAVSTPLVTLNISGAARAGIAIGG